MHDLRRLYREHGVAVESDAALLQQIREDWRLHRQYAELATTTGDGLSEPTPITIDIDNRRYHLFGVIHSWSTGRRYQDAYGAVLAKFNDVVAEQGIRAYFRLPPGSVSCADWAPIQPGELFKDTFIQALDIIGPKIFV
jgi:hypothetical protein